MTSRRDLLIALGAGAFAAPLRSLAQQKPAKVSRIGFLGSASASVSAPRVEALREGLRELGDVEGKNLNIEFRWAEGNYDRLRELAAELVGLKVEVIVTHGVPGTLALKRATKTIPIVMAYVGDAVATGLVASLARPGGNVTGSTFFNPELSAKRLELLKEVVPRITRVGVLLNSDNPVNPTVLQAMELAAGSLNVELRQFGVRGPKDFDGAFAAMAKSRVDAVAILEDPMLSVNGRAAADFALKHRLPSAGFLELAEAGGLLAYGANAVEMFRHSARFVDKILKGATPADLPIERATKFELLINRKTAKALGLTIPQTILLRADRVIE